MPPYLGGVDALRPIRAAVLYDLALNLWPFYRAAGYRKDYARNCTSMNVWDR